MDNTLIDWLGKADDISISYEAGVRDNSIFLSAQNTDANIFPAMIYPSYDNIREVENIVWEDTVKKAERIDYLIAVACGAISGLIDVFYVGEFSIERARDWGADKINRFVGKVAELNGFDGGSLAEAIRFLEKKYPLAADTKTSDFGGGLQHHLRDFSHHFSLGGLICSLFTQFTGQVIGTDTDGTLLLVELADTNLVGKNFEEKVLFGTIKWFFHMVSDMAGSNATAGKGTGIPGVIVSLIKELSAIPCFQNQKINEYEFHTWVSKLFNGTLLAKRDKNGNILKAMPFDLRSEIGSLHEVGRQFVPVLINECLVRSFYFVRRFCAAVQDRKIHSIADFDTITAADLLPFNNQVITRMITVASGVFTAVDVVDAAVRAAVKNRGVNPKFFVDFAVRINIVGVGRFIIACKEDVRFISDDILEAKTKRHQAEKDYEKMIADLKCLSLDYEQIRILHSVENLILKDDIDNTTDVNAKIVKEKWAVLWRESLLKDLRLVEEERDSFLLKEEEVACYFNEHEDGAWKYLIAMEAMLYKPYYPMFGDEKDSEFKKVKCKSRYLTVNFVKAQHIITKDDFEKLDKSFKQAGARITGSQKAIVIGAVGTTAAVFVTGGVAFAFAPFIATTLVGQAATGLSGAALVSYSLASIGGGSLAAGGLGMAGGTAIITGGGALVGMLGSTGISAATTVSLLSDDSYVLRECCKLFTFCKMALNGKYIDVITVSELRAIIRSRMDEIQQQLTHYTEREIIDDKGDAKNNKIKIRIAKKSVKYLGNTCDALDKLIKQASSTGRDIIVKRT